MENRFEELEKYFNGCDKNDAIKLTKLFCGLMKYCGYKFRDDISDDDAKYYEYLNNEYNILNVVCLSSSVKEYRDILQLYKDVENEYSNIECYNIVITTEKSNYINSDTDDEDDDYEAIKNYARLIFDINIDSENKLNYMSNLILSIAGKYKEEKFECDLKVGDTVRNETDGELYEVKKIVRAYEPFTFTKVTMLKVKPKGFDCELYFEYTPNITKVVDE